MEVVVIYFNFAAVSNFLLLLLSQTSDSCPLAITIRRTDCEGEISSEGGIVLIK